MSLLVRIAELVFFIMIARSLWALVRPRSKKPDSPSRGGKPERFTSENTDISDADYEELP